MYDLDWWKVWLHSGSGLLPAPVRLLPPPEIFKNKFFKEVWWSSGQSPCLYIAHPGFETRPGASPQCGLKGGR